MLMHVIPIFFYNLDSFTITMYMRKYQEKMSMDKNKVGKRSFLNTVLQHDLPLGQNFSLVDL